MSASKIPQPTTVADILSAADRYRRPWTRNDPYAVMAVAPDAIILADAFIAERAASTLTRAVIERAVDGLFRTGANIDIRTESEIVAYLCQELGAA